jgi:hypothetical protein
MIIAFMFILVVVISSGTNMTPAFEFPLDHNGPFCGRIRGTGKILPLRAV